MNILAGASQGGQDEGFVPRTGASRPASSADRIHPARSEGPRGRKTAGLTAIPDPVGRCRFDSREGTILGASGQNSFPERSTLNLIVTWLVQRQPTTTSPVEVS